MPKFNTSFDLDVHDIDLIETALQQRKKELSLKRLAMLSSTDESPDQPSTLARLDDTLVDIHALLGRLHNQKVFYRPDAETATPYVSG